MEAHRQLEVEASQLRFRINFGSSTCDSCQGLRAGEGVVATCFQVKRCNYENFREDNTSRKHLTVIQKLLGEGDQKTTPNPKSFEG